MTLGTIRGFTWNGPFKHGGTRRRCPDCKGAHMVYAIPNVHALHPEHGPGEPSWIICKRCRASGFVIIDGLGVERPAVRQRITL